MASRKYDLMRCGNIYRTLKPKISQLSLV